MQVSKKQERAIRSLIKFKEFTLTHICDKRLRRSIITIDEYGEITVKTPYKSKTKLLTLLQEKEEWLRQTLTSPTIRKKPDIPLEVELFGQIVPVAKTDLLLRIKRLKERNPKSIERAYDTFYKELAKEYLPKRVEHFEEKMGLKCKMVRFRKMKRRWGSCSSEGVITFNTNLLKRDKSFIDEVVVHELAHLVHFNHSRAFYELLSKYT